MSSFDVNQRWISDGTTSQVKVPGQEAVTKLLSPLADCSGVIRGVL